MLVHDAGHPESERGAALIEFAAGPAPARDARARDHDGRHRHHRKLDLLHATREGARYGATLATTQCVPTSNCGGKTWAQLSRDVAVQRSFNDLTAGVGTTAGVRITQPTTFGRIFGTTQTRATRTAVLRAGWERIRRRRNSGCSTPPTVLR